MAELLALATAAAFAVSNLLIRLAGRHRNGPGHVAPAWTFQLYVLWWTTLVNVFLLWTAWITWSAWTAWPLVGPDPGTTLGAGATPGTVTGLDAAPGAGDLRGTAAFVAAGLAGPLLGRIALYRGLAHLGPGRLAAGKASTPLLAALLGAFVLGEPIGWRLAVAVTLVGLGTAWTVTDALRMDRLGLLYGLHAAWWLAVAALLRRVGVLALPDVLLGAATGSTAALAVIAALLWRHRRRPRWRLLERRVRWSLLGSGALSAVALTTAVASLGLAPLGPMMALHHTEPAIAQWLGHGMLRGSDRVGPRALLGTAVVVVGALFA